MFSLKDQVAVVTGGSRGIGKAIALKLALAGAYVFVVNRNSEAGSKVIDEIKENGGNGEAIAGDVSQKEDCVGIVQKIAESQGRLDILVNNAGVTRDNIFLRMTDDQWRDVFKTNLDSVFYLSREASKIMLKKRYGRIINVSSVVGFTGNPGQVNYSSTKSALIGFSKSLGKELASRNITCNIVAPGFIESDMTNDLNEKQKEAIIKSIPSGKIGQPEDVAYSVLFLASKETAYVNGMILHVNGGIY